MHHSVHRQRSNDRLKCSPPGVNLIASHSSFANVSELSRRVKAHRLTPVIAKTAQINCKEDGCLQKTEVVWGELSAAESQKQMLGSTVRSKKQCEQKWLINEIIN